MQNGLEEELAWVALQFSQPEETELESAGGHFKYKMRAGMRIDDGHSHINSIA